MKLPDSVVLAKIQKKNLYYDVDSLEKTTSRKRNKYKLAGNILAGVYTFFITFSKDCACCKRYTVTIKRSDWKNKMKGYLKKPNSYVDLSKKPEILAESEILNKINDVKNGFKYVACLCDSKFQEIESIRSILPRGYDYADEKANLVDVALGEINEANRLLQELGLSKK